MNKALVTGASSGIGKEITKVLLDMGFWVFGVHNKTPMNFCGNLEAMQCDLRDIKQINELFMKITAKTQIDLLVNCAGVGHFANHQDLSVEKICQMIDLNLKAPLVLSKLFAKDLLQKKGMIINISSISGRQNAKFAATYGATKAGLESFSKSFFEETRKQGLRVVNLASDLSLTPFYKDQSFSPQNKLGAFVEPRSVARAVKFIVTQKEGELISDILIRPQQILLDKGKK